LYELLRAAPSAFADLRLCYRIRRLELSATALAEEVRAIDAGLQSSDASGTAVLL
jgi:hypothetical protein